MKTIISSNAASLRNEAKHQANAYTPGLFATFLIKTATLFSSLLEEEITPRQTQCLIHSLVAFTAMVFPLEMPLLLRFGIIAWFSITLLQCRQAGLGEEREKRLSRGANPR